MLRAMFVCKTVKRNIMGRIDWTLSVHVRGGGGAEKQGQKTCLDLAPFQSQVITGPIFVGKCPPGGQVESSTIYLLEWGL
jgi:hypothetical protein